MPSVADLESAGRRAALAPVPSAPPVESLLDAAGRHRTRNRLLSGAAAAALVLVLALPLALLLDRSDTVTVVAATGDDAAPAAQAAQDEAGDDTSTEGSDPAPSQPSPAGAQPDDESDSARIDLTLGDGFAFSVEVVSGNEAAPAAAEAAGRADETRTVDEHEVWIETDGDTTTVSVLAEPDVFVAVTGPAEELDRLLDALENGDFDFEGGDFGQFGEGFALPFDGFEDFDFGEGFPFEDFEHQFGEGFPFDGFEDFEHQFGEGFPFDGFDFGDLEDGEFPFGTFELDGEAFPFDGFDFGDLENGEFPFGTFELDGENFPFDDFDFGDLEDGEFPFGSFEDGEFPALDWFADGGGCVSIDIRGQESRSFEFPEGCSAD